MAEDPAKPIIATNAKGMAPATVMSQKAPIIAPSGSGKLLQNKNFLIILAIGGAIILALIIALIIVVTNGKS